MRLYIDNNNPDNWHIMRQDEGAWSSKNGLSGEYRGITSPNAFYSKYFLGGWGGKIRTIDYFVVKTP